jgi:lipoprotein-anchoring transpeptidase ErfK/SrfK
MRSYRGLRASWVATALALVLGLGAVGGVASLPGHGRGDVARAAALVRPGSPHAVALRRAAVLAADARAAAHTKHAAAKPLPELLVRVPTSMTVRARPSATSRSIGLLPSSSKYYHVGLWAWVETTARHERWGRVSVPYTWPHREGWIPLRGLHRSRTFVEVHVELARHWVSVTRFGKPLYGFRAGTGAAYSPTPSGRYFVTDRIPFSPGFVLGSFAFGISGIQPHLPAGWSGGDQLAIHGTNEPWTIGRNASAGCVHVSERALRELEPILRLGTPVIIG